MQKQKIDKKQPHHEKNNTSINFMFSICKRFY